MTILPSILDEFWGLAPLERTASFAPALDVAEGDESYVISLDVPGVKEGDLSIEMRDNVLTIRGHRAYGFDQGSVDGLRRIERASGNFERSIRLPDGSEDVSAKLSDGVLMLTVAKPAKAQPRRIEIESNQKTLEGSVS